MSDGSETSPTAAALLETLRQVTGRPGLDYATPPAHLAGGFYAEMVRFRLADAPAELAGDLVARIVPHAAAGEWEATIQRHVAAQRFPTPAVRLTAPASGPLGRYLIVMDHVAGRPPLGSLSPRSLAADAPGLVRRLPVQLAEIAADLHRLDPEPLVRDLDALGGARPTTVAAFVAANADMADAAGRPDLASVARRLLDTQPPSPHRAITHGDLHPFNLLVADGRTVVIDWTVAAVGHPAFTVAFTELMLANPPMTVPRPLAGPLGALGRRLARRFVGRYRQLTDASPAAVDDEALAWHRKVHALRILAELAGWDAAGNRPTAGHPWLILEPVAERALGLDGGR